MLDNPFLKELFSWSLMVLGALIALVIIMKVMKGLAGSRVRKLQMEMMTLDDLERMRQTGLLGDEEYARARLNVARRLVEQSLPKPSIPAETALQIALSDLEQSPPKANPPESSGAPIPSGSPTIAPPTITPPAPAPNAPQVPTKKPLPPLDFPSMAAAAEKKESKLFDLEKLRSSGAIDEAEYQRLKSYLAKRK